MKMVKLMTTSLVGLLPLLLGCEKLEPFGGDYNKPPDITYVNKISDRHIDRANDFTLKNWRVATIRNDSIYEIGLDAPPTYDSIKYRDSILIPQAIKLFKYIYVDDPPSVKPQPWLHCYMDYFIYSAELKKEWLFHVSLEDSVFTK